MFKGTNKLWKGLALVLALCMLSTVAYAAGEPSTAVISDFAGSYDEATQTVTITGKIDVPGNDVTILAVRDGAEYDELTDVWTEEMLPAKVVYIDQATSNKTTGAFSFSFVPREDVVGGWISVFVGGEDVAEIKTYSTKAQENAPVLVLPDTWYEGETTLEIELKDGEGNAYANAEDWAEVINAVTIAPVAKDDLTWGLNAAKTHLVLSGFETTGETITSITITTTGGAFEDAVSTGIAQEAKDLGEDVLTFTGTVVAPGTAEITVTTDDEDWKDALNNAGVVTKDGVEATATYSNDILSVEGFDIVNKAENTEETFTVTVHQDYYVDETVEVTVVAPTKNQLTADASIANIGVVYSATTPDDDADVEVNEDNKTEWGQASITLPAAPSAAFNYVWTLTCEDIDAVLPADAATGLATGTAVVLDRPAYGSEQGSFAYVLTLTIKDAEGEYADAKKEYTLIVNEVGVAGVPVATVPSFGDVDEEANAAIAADAEITLSGASGDINLTWDAATSSFKGENIVPGEYTITIVRPGFLVASSTIEVLPNGEISGTMPEMIAGDTDGNGEIDVLDVNEIVNNWGSTTDVATNLDGNDIVDILDVNIVVNNWGAQGVGTDDLE